jgi:hypothetical protein
VTVRATAVQCPPLSDSDTARERPPSRPPAPPSATHTATHANATIMRRGQYPGPHTAYSSDSDPAEGATASSASQPDAELVKGSSRWVRAKGVLGRGAERWLRQYVQPVVFSCSPLAVDGRRRRRRQVLQRSRWTVFARRRRRCCCGGSTWAEDVRREAQKGTRRARVRWAARWRRRA